jgi:hypothetical protein
MYGLKPVPLRLKLVFFKTDSLPKAAGNFPRGLCYARNSLINGSSLVTRASVEPSKISLP